MSNRQDDALPELPAAYGYVDADGELHRYGHIGHLGDVGDLYTEGQMRAYAQSAIASLQARLDAAEKDAERYRWMRDMDLLDAPSVDLADAFHRYTGTALDSAIDEIMGRS